MKIDYLNVTIFSFKKNVLIFQNLLFNVLQGKTKAKNRIYILIFNLSTILID